MSPVQRKCFFILKYRYFNENEHHLNYEAVLKRANSLSLHQRREKADLFLFKTLHNLIDSPGFFVWSVHYKISASVYMAQVDILSYDKC